MPRPPVSVIRETDKTIAGMSLPQVAALVNIIFNKHPKIVVDAVKILQDTEKGNPIVQPPSFIHEEYLVSKMNEIVKNAPADRSVRIYTIGQFRELTHCGLSEAKEWVEKNWYRITHLTLADYKTNANSTHKLWSMLNLIVGTLAFKDKVEAVRFMRNATGCLLTEAKDYVETNWQYTLYMNN